MSLYLHRGVFETALEDEDIELDPDRWCSHAAWGQEAWQIVAQWTWNIRLELGHKLAPEPVRTTEFAPALPLQNKLPPPDSPPASGYAPPTTATSWKADRFTGADFLLQPDETLRCLLGARSCRMNTARASAPASGSLRVVYGASIRACRPCSLREQCQWNGSATDKPRQVSMLLHPLAVGSAPLLWRDWHQRHQRHACLHLHKSRLDIQMGPDVPPTPTTSPPILSRAHRAHARLSWEERLASVACKPQAGQLTLKLFGIPETFASWLGLRSA